MYIIRDVDHSNASISYEAEWTFIITGDMARAFIQRAKESPSTVISEFVEGMTSGKGNLLPPDLTFKDLLRAEHGDLDAQKKVKEAFDAMDDTGFCFLAGPPSRSPTTLPTPSSKSN